ncbi:phosphoadenosine phosphosulfate reductase [Pseudoalteromonas phage KB12-38]|nr:phosphoadenosine phosphosulfate reductase [Pseudoalteromonas phage KB12-38]
MTFEQLIDKNKALVVNCGMGTNSIALLVLLHQKGLRPDVILFADVGNEMPHTYDYIPILQEWLAKVGFPKLSITRKKFKDGSTSTLYDYCIEKQTLPSLAYGNHTCSAKWKIQAMDVFYNNHPATKAVWGKFYRCSDIKNKVTKLIGFDSLEPERTCRFALPKNTDNPAIIREKHKFDVSFPLQEWGYNREDCTKIILEAGLPDPGKSACFFCPSTQPEEILAMSKSEPELYQKAIKLEEVSQANPANKNKRVQGLRFGKKWTAVVQELTRGNVTPSTT